MTRLAARLGRHAVLLTAKMLEGMPSVVEPICYDHFETFGVSQFLPVGIGTPIAVGSRMMLGFHVAPHRRRERMSDEQKRRRAMHRTRERWDWDRFFARRLQPRHVDLPEDWRALYFRETAFPPCAEGKRHESKLAIRGFAPGDQGRARRQGRGVTSAPSADPAYPVDTRPRAVHRRTAASEAHDLRSTVKKITTPLTRD